MILGKSKKQDNNSTSRPPKAPKQPASTQSATQTKGNPHQKMSKFAKIKLFFTIVSTLFFVCNSIYWVFNKWGDFSSLLWVMLAVTLAYILVFVITLVKHGNSAKQMAVDSKKFKVQIKLMRTVSDLLFIVMTGLVLVQNLVTWQETGNLFLLVSTFVSGFVLFVQLISTLLRIIKLNKKRKKLNKKQQSLNAK